MAQKSEAKAVPGAHRSAPAGSLENTLRALSDHVAQEHNKTVNLDCQGLQSGAAAISGGDQERRHSAHPQRRDARHRDARRTRCGRQSRRTAVCGWNSSPCPIVDSSCCSRTTAAASIREQVRATAIARGVITDEGATRLRDREAIKLIFKSGYTTLANAPGEAPHGSGMSLVRRYVHEAGGKIAIASLLGHETRFKVSLPPLPAGEAA